MRILAVLLAALILLLPAHAQEIYSPVHNLTYHLGEEAEVEEKLKLVIEPFSIREPLHYPLPEDASGVAVKAPGKAKYTVDIERKEIILDLYHVPKRYFFIYINYTRENSISTAGGESTFSSKAFRRYIPWTTYIVNIKFILPENYDFGRVSPEARVYDSGEKRAIKYSLGLQNNLPEISQGMPVELTYANYRKLAENKMTVVTARESGAFLAFKDANRSLENALSHKLNMTSSLSLYSQAEDELYSYLREVRLAERLIDQYRAYPQAYTHLERASNLLENVSIHSREVSQRANSEVQRQLEVRIEEATGLAGEEELRNKTSPPPQEEGRGWEEFLPLLLLPLLALAFAYYTRSRAKPAEIKKRGRVGDYGVISDLKKRKYLGFDQKVEKVKERTEISSDIRKLSRMKRKYELGMENLKRKFTSGEIDEEIYEGERRGMNEEIEALDSRIELLNRRLAELKKKGEK